MATQIDDVRYEPPATWIKVLETALMTLATPTIGWILHTEDPLFLDSSFSWLIIAPLLAGIRYGFVYGFSSALATLGLMVLDGYGWLTPAEQTGQVAVTYAVGVILVGMIAGEVADVWQRRLTQMSVVNSTQATRLGEFVRHYHLLRVSHDQLAERLAATPHTLRDALLQLDRKFRHTAPGEDALPRHAGDILSFLAVHGKLQQGALYRVGPDGSLDPGALETFGGLTPTSAMVNHPMLRACLQQRRMMCLKSAMDQGLPEEEDGLLATVPLIDVHDQIWAIVVITEMPFIDYHRGQLHLLSVLGSNLGDVLRNAYTRRPDDEQATHRQFASALERWTRYAHRHELYSLLVTLELPPHLDRETRRSIADLVFDQLRTLDTGWVVTGTDGAQQIHALLPLTDKQGARPYRNRLTQLLHTRYAIDATGNEFVFHHRVIDGSRPARKILGDLEQSVSQRDAA